MSHKKSCSVWLHCISAALVTADDMRSVLGSYFHDGNSERYIKSYKVWLLLSSEIPQEARTQLVKSGLLFPSGRHLGVQECTMRNLTADHKAPQRCHAPSLYIPCYQLKWIPQPWRSELARPERKLGFLRLGREHRKSTLVQGKPVGVPNLGRCAATSGLPGSASTLRVGSRSQPHPARAGWDWADAKMRSGCWAAEQTLWLLPEEVCQLLSLNVPTYQESPLWAFVTTLYLLCTFSYVRTCVHAPLGDH